MSRWAISPGVSCSTGVATTSRRTPRCSAASSENAPAIVPNASQSVRASHGGGTAWLNECTNGCMSVIERSCFSYQVAAGRTTSEYRPVVRRAEQMAQEVLLALARGAEQVRAPDEEHAWPVLRRARVLDGELQP